MFLVKQRWVLGLAMIALPMYAQTGLLGTKTPDGSVKFQVVEDFRVAQSDKVRLMPADTQTLDPNLLKRLLKVDLDQIGLVRRQADGRIVQLTEKGANRAVLLSEKLQLKASVPGASAQERLLLDYLTSKKAKMRDAVAPELFLVYVPAMDPDRAAFDLVNSAWAFESLDEQLAAMAAFFAAFPSSPSRSAFQGILESRLNSGFTAFEAGGSYSDLLLTDRFIPLATSVFRGEANVARLSESIRAKIAFVESSRTELRSLAGARYWDAFLAAYTKMEPYQWSFPDLQRLHDRALEESTREHAQLARAFQARLDHESSIGEVRRALTLDPENSDLDKLLENEHVSASRTAASVAATGRKTLDPQSAQGVRFRRELDNVPRAIGIQDFAKAEESIRNAEGENAAAPEVALAQAQLAQARGQLRAALNLLDRYDRLASEPAQRDEGNRLRGQIEFDLSTKTDSQHAAIRAAIEKGDYAAAGTSVREALNMDSTDQDTLYLAGTVLAVLRDGETARSALEKFLQTSDTIGGDMKRRDTARRLLGKVVEQKTPPLTGSMNWMSGRREPSDVFYAPRSLAFQWPIQSISGEKFLMSFSWKDGKLDNIATKFEDEKGKLGYVSYVRQAAPSIVPGAPPPAPQAPSSPQAAAAAAVVAAGVDAGSFFFDYFPDGRLRNIRSKRLAKPESETFFLVKKEKDGAVLIDSDQRARVVMPQDPQVNADFLAALGTPVTTLVSGNPYFNPFVWDGVHYFAATYDAQGRVESAREWGADNLLKFTWNGQRLTEIQAFRKESSTPYYKRTIAYKDSQIVAESYSGPGKTGEIKYNYNKAVLERATVDDNGAHDSHSWTAALGPVSK